MKIFDFDAAFEEYCARFIEKNKGKYTAEELENVQPKLFEKFSDLKIKNIGMLTPKEFYAGRGDAIVSVLKEHLRRGIPVNVFLENALASEASEETLLSCLNPFFDGEYLGYIIDALERKNTKIADNRYIDLLFDESTPDETVDRLIEILSERADSVSEKLLTRRSDDRGVEAACEILSSTKNHSEKITEYIREAILSHASNPCAVLGAVTRYGEESLLGALMEIVKNPNLGYIDYKELRLAIESLGGSYDDGRDFSSDPNYKRLHGE